MRKNRLFYKVQPFIAFCVNLMLVKKEVLVVSLKLINTLLSTVGIVLGN